MSEAHIFTASLSDYKSQRDGFSTSPPCGVYEQYFVEIEFISLYDSFGWGHSVATWQPDCYFFCLEKHEPISVCATQKGVGGEGDLTT